MLEQQRLSQTKNMQRERSPLRNGTESDGARIKEEPKRETVDEMMMRGPPNVVPDPRYAAAHAQHLAAAHNYMVGRHMMPGQLPPVSFLHPLPLAPEVRLLYHRFLPDVLTISLFFSLLVGTQYSNASDGWTPNATFSPTNRLAITIRIGCIP